MYIYIYTYTYTHIHTYTHTYTHTCTHTYTYTYTCTYTYTHTYTHTHIYIYIYMYIHIYAYTYTYTYTHTTHIYIYIYIHTSTRATLNPRGPLGTCSPQRPAAAFLIVIVITTINHDNNNNETSEHNSNDSNSNNSNNSNNDSNSSNNGQVFPRLRICYPAIRHPSPASLYRPEAANLCQAFQTLVKLMTSYYFQQMLYCLLNVPISRLEAVNSLSFGRSNDAAIRHPSPASLYRPEARQSFGRPSFPGSLRAGRFAGREKRPRSAALGTANQQPAS